VMSAGSTGAIVATAQMRLRPLPGVTRPALAVALPTRPTPAILIDAGAIADPKPEMLLQFAQLGVAYAQTAFGIAEPRVGLLTIGSEPGKGNKLARRAYELLDADPPHGGLPISFVGNLEGGDLLDGRADVIVTDGLTGNIALKLLEGVSQTMLNGIRSAARSSARAKLGGALLRPSLRAHFGGIDPEAHGGAYLLGLRRLGVVPHGRFHRRGFAQAILRARQAVADDLTASTHAALRAAGALRPTPASAQSASLPPSQ
jgi:glycerol-3-phosphate acyltransferase PlsX